LAAARRAFLFIYAVFSNDYGTDPARLSSQASVTPPKGVCLHHFYAMTWVKRPIRGCLESAILSQSMLGGPPTAALGVIGNTSNSSRISAVRRADTRYSMCRSIAA
jgi:hypothetical protein